MKTLFITIIFLAASAVAFGQEKSEAQKFFDNIKQHCGKAYEGKVTEGGRPGDAFSNGTLVMHVRSCEDNRIRIPFFVGDDRSRTWVLTLENDRILLKHDHRHEDGSEDDLTQYGGWTANKGHENSQMFPADAFTCDLIDYGCNNVWFITINETEYTYNLRRIGTDRLFSVSFDLTKPIEVPPAPWGWED